MASGFGQKATALIPCLERLLLRGVAERFLHMIEQERRLQSTAMVPTHINCVAEYVQDQL